MPHQSRIVAPGSDDRSVRTATGEILHPPADWSLLPPGDAALTCHVKAAGRTWSVPQAEVPGRVIVRCGRCWRHGLTLDLPIPRETMDGNKGDAQRRNDAKA